MQYFNNEIEYRNYIYKREIRKTSNNLGVLLIVFLAAQLILGTLASFMLVLTGTYSFYESDSAMTLLMNGALSAAIFVLIGLVYCLIKRLSFAKLFAFERISAGTVVMLAVIGLAVSLMSNYAADLVTDVFGLFGVSNKGGDILEEGTLPSVFLYYLTVAFLPALGEEFAFRGVIMGSLRKYSDALALVVSAGAFSLMHGNFVQIPFTFCCGLAFGYIAIKSNSLLPSIIVHFLNNALAVTSDVLVSYKIMPLEGVNLGYGAIFAVTGALALVFVYRIIRKSPDFFRFEDSDRIIPFREKMKASALSPTMMTFAVLMLLFSTYVLIQPYIMSTQS